jgi:hypothetical protein
VDLRLLSWYKVFDEPVDAAPDSTTGLLHVDGSPKPAYFAYQTMTSELAGARYVGPYQASGVEGYVFATPAGPHKAVLWSTAGTARVTLPYTRLRVVTATGTEYSIQDNQIQTGAPGDVDSGIPGQIGLDLVENEPFYVEPK